jgi:hypothetical protein
MTKRRKRGVISEAFYIIELPIRFVTEVTNEVISDVVSLIDPRQGRRGRRRVSTNY